MTHTDIEQNARGTLEALWEFARRACHEVETFAPDLVIVLYHSGQVALRATRAAWATAYETPFPPVVATNLGREKIKPYDALRKDLGNAPFVAFLDPLQWGAHFLAWVADHPEWQEALRAQVEAVWQSPTPPSRILVLDDFIHEGSTWLLALGLLSVTFPETTSKLIAGTLDDWKTPLARRWLAQHAPTAYEGLEESLAEAKQRLRTFSEAMRAGDDLRSHGDDPGEPLLYPHVYTDLERVVPGTEDAAPGSLDWRPIGPESEALQRLTPYLPIETLLALPEILYGEVERYVQGRAADAAAWDAPLRHGYDVASVGLPFGAVALREAWRRGRLTRREVVALERCSPAQASRLLKEWTRRGFLVRRGLAGGTTYELQSIDRISTL